MSNKIAIILRGGVAKKTGRLIKRESMNDDGEYVNFQSASCGIIKHIIDANPSFQFDFFIHSWNKDLEAALRKLYNPVSAIFEDNIKYKELFDAKINNINEYGGVSSLLSLKKAIELVEQHHVFYDQIIIYRPDVLIWKDINLKLYDHKKIYVNAHPGGDGDFHFIMNSANMSRFKWCYNWISRDNPYAVHSSIRRFVESKMGDLLYMDDIIPGSDQEVIRKIPDLQIDDLFRDKLMSYGLKLDDIYK